MAWPEIPWKCQPQNLFKIISIQGRESSCLQFWNIKCFKDREPKVLFFSSQRCQMEVEWSPGFSFASDNFLSVRWCFGSLSVDQVCSSSSSPPLLPTAWQQRGCLGTCSWAMFAVKFRCLNSTTCHLKVEVISTTLVASGALNTVLNFFLFCHFAVNVYSSHCWKFQAPVHRVKNGESPPVESPETCAQNSGMC